METKKINNCVSKLKKFLFLGVLISAFASAQNFNSDVYYRIVAKHSGKVLDVAFKDQGDQANVIQHTWQGGDNQCWKIEPAAAVITVS